MYVHLFAFNVSDFCIIEKLSGVLTELMVLKMLSLYFNKSTIYFVKENTTNTKLRKSKFSNVQ